uniref:Lipocalin/cytosolic fatty-acid binding domain-containing protein n=1 Tax=Amblyomma maculatum TaxID=34609 RepID=G3MSU2_AMBMU
MLRAWLFETVLAATAIFDEDLDGDLDCVRGIRTEFNKEAQTASYVWLLKGQNGQPGTNITFHVKTGPTPGTAYFRLDDSDGPWNTIQYLYSDFKNCLVLDVPLMGGEQCMLWAMDEVKNNVPQHCTEKFKDICELEVLAYDEESCSTM